jgi:hypothetical protein
LSLHKHSYLEDSYLLPRRKVSTIKEFSAQKKIMAPFNGTPTRNQQVTLALAPKVASILSILGSCYILHDCWRKPAGRRNTFHRLMMGLCAVDVITSTGFFVGNWAMPVDTPNVWGAMGTVRSCEAVGFLVQSSVSGVLYNGGLSIYYLLRIRSGWTPVQMRKIEPYLHLVPLVFGLSTMSASLALDLFNSGIFDCWIAPYPQGCEQSWEHGGTTTCLRGDNASLYQWLFDLIPKWSSILLVTVNMWLTHRGVYRQEQSVIRRLAAAPNNHNNDSVSTTSDNRLPHGSMAKRLARQSYLYVGALYLTWFPVTITRLTELVTGRVYYEMLLFISIAIPLQGLWNGTTTFYCSALFMAATKFYRN